MIRDSAPEDSVHLYTDGVRVGSPQSGEHFRKHGIRFADAVPVLEDERAMTLRVDDDDEERWVTIGMDSLGRILVVAYTWRGKDLRMISARLATPEERRHYVEEL